MKNLIIRNISSPPKVGGVRGGILKKIRLRTWVSLGLIIVLTPLVFAMVYRVFGAFGGSTVSPSAYWSFDEGVDNTCSGGTNDVCDNSGNANDGAFGASTAAPTWQTEDKCVSGKCLYFDGSNDTVTIANTVSGIQTVSFWAKILDTSTTQEIIDLNATDYFTSASGTVTVTAFGTDTIYVDGVSGANTLSPSKWHHIAITTTTGFSGSAITVGNVSTNFGNLFLDEVKLFSSALTSSQIKAEFTGGAAVFGAQDTNFLNDGLVGYWNLDESSGNATDTSGNGLTLTNNATTTYETGKFGNGSEHVPASSQYLSTATTVSGVKTVSFWTNPDSTTDYYISLTSSAYITSSSGTLSATGFTSPTIYVNGVQTTTISADVWQLVTVVTDTSIDADTFYVGRQGSNYYDGTMDEVRVYNRSLSPAEVKALYNWAPGPVGHWKMDESSWTVDCSTDSAFDTSGNGYNGNACPNTTGPSGGEPGKYGSSGLFDGSNDYVDMGDVLDMGTANVSVGAWVKYTSATDLRILSKKDGGTNSQGYALGVDSSGFPYFNVGDGTNGDQATDSTTYADGSWHYFAGVWEAGSSAKLYVDGVLKNTDSSISTTGTLSNAVSLVFGRSSSGGSYWSGYIDEVKIYNYPRTQQQVVEDMNAGHPTGGSPVGSQVSHWKFDEMYGDTANDTVNSHNGDFAGSGTTCPQSSDSACPTWTSAGKVNGAIDFVDGTTDDYISITDNAAFDLTTAIALSAFIKPDDSAAVANIISKYDTGANQRSYRLFLHTDDTLRMTVSSDGTATQEVTSSLVLTRDGSTWYHVIGIYDGSQLLLYVDGKQVGSQSYSSDIHSGSANVCLGCGLNSGSPNNHFYGIIDEPKIYSSALTQEQILIDMNGGASTNFGFDSDEKDDVEGGAGDPPVGYWDFNEKVSGDAQTIYDKSGNSNNGTTGDGANNTGVDCSVAAKYGSGCQMDGVDDYISISNPSEDNFGTGEMSVSAWVKYTIDPDDSGQTQYQLLDNKTAGTNNAGFNLQINASNIAYFRIANGSAQASASASTVTLNDGVWHHVMGTLSRGTPDVISIYIDGQLRNTANPAADGWNITSAQSLMIGAFGTGTTQANLNGIIDEAKMWDYALTPAQVAYEFNRGEPIGWWRLDECTGTTANDAGSAGNNGTITIGSSGTNTDTSAGDCSSGDSTESWNNGTTGKFSSSVHFDGTDDYITMGDPTDGSLDFGIGDFSISYWANDSTLNSVHVSKRPGSAGSGWRVGFTSTTMTFRLDDGTTPIETSCATGLSSLLNAWHHAVFVFDRDSNLSCYMDGELVGTFDISGTNLAVSNSSPFNINAYNNTISVAGTVGQTDDVRVYNYTLSGNQIKKLYNGGASVRF